jgi:hypothetical protein
VQQEPTSPPDTSRTERLARLAWFAVAVVGAIAGVATFVLHITQDPLADVRAYYDAGARLNAGLPLYDQPATTNDAEFYRYPPLLAIAFRPVAAVLPYETAAVLWGLLGVAAFALTLWTLGLRRFEVWIAVGALGLPIGWSLAIGQAQVEVTWLLAVGAPWAVALAANLKVFPLLVAVFWLGRRDWRALGWFIGAMVGLVLLQLILEPAGTVEYLRFLSLEQVGEVRNLSPYAISAMLWAVLAAALGLLALRLAPTRWGWAVAVTLSVLAAPRLLSYMLMTLLAALRPGSPGRTPAADRSLPAPPR